METLDHYLHSHNVYDAQGKAVTPPKPSYTATPVKDQGMVQKAGGDLKGRGETLAEQIRDAGG